jgi:NTE family protein
MAIFEASGEAFSLLAWRVVAAIVLLAGIAGCATVHNEPRNVSVASATQAADVGREDPTHDDNLLIGVSFSGGGTRAAAFAHGALLEMDRTRAPGSQPTSLLDRLDFVSGVSGGAVTAAYYGLKKRAALADFREKFLLRNAEEAISTNVSLVNLSRALGGGINDGDKFPRWLDDNLFEGATFAAFRAQRRPRIWINASDIYNRTTFVFGATAFRAICSDLNSYRISDAVAASAAVPVVFAPVVLKTFPQECKSKPPEWIVRARQNKSSPPMLRAFADAVIRYTDGSMPYIKLLDGGLVDNFGLSGFTIARLSSDTPYGPMTETQAVKMRRVMFIVIDAGRGPSGDWVKTVEGPAGVDLVMAASDTAVDASVRASFTAFDRTMSDWQLDLVKWRCGLSAAQRKKYGAPANWNCRDVKFFVGRVGFDQLGDARAAQLQAIPTRFTLPQEQVDALIAAGSDALRNNPTYQAFLNSMRGGAQPAGPSAPALVSMVEPPRH